MKQIRDIFLNKRRSKVYLVTWYIDSEDEIVGIYPLEDGGFTESELLSVQYKNMQFSAIS
ncbi:hypothetical protein SECTIM467_154 [Brevibacillus phage SecTim467]|uniref:Uncharacterized protein n=2 Tax=Jenstvirus jenst TaxID=1982225 RepID=A0A0K2CP29_9CAUD|nr:hypothetical protein AVV11_gp042 [Brevibacillus phage Jenst]ALA07278.1 hypothetical protein JENST_149 [Brevibacillus phage Jenst]ALA07478.1 hypothetical protein SECTIM467_154 [Brevibacillus phage SecTim467]